MLRPLCIIKEKGGISMRKITKILLCFITAILMCGVLTVSADAASYQKITQTKVKMSGKYFYCDSNNKIKVAKNATEAGKSITGNYVTGITNGVYIYYGATTQSDGMNVFRYDVRNGKKIKICYVKHGESVVGFYDGKLYVTRHNFSGSYGHDYTYLSTYQYDVATKTLRKAVDNIVAEGYDKYMYGMPNTGAMMTLPFKVFNASTKKVTVVDRNAIAYNRLGSYIYVARAVPYGAGFKVRVAKYNLKTGKYTWATSKTFVCQYVNKLYSGKVSYRDLNGRYKEMRY